VAALHPESAFLTLSITGTAVLADALTRLQNAAGFVLEGLTSLENETDDQSDDIIKFDPTGSGSGVTQEDIDEVRDIVLDVQAALTEATLVTIPVDDEEEIELTVDLREFFLTPIADLKTLLPDYTMHVASEGGDDVAILRWQALNLEDWIIPQPTFSGVLPGMTHAELMDTFPMEGVFVGASVAGGDYQLVSIDEEDCLGIPPEVGCLVNDMTIYDAWLYLEGRDGMQRVEFYVDASGGGSFEEGTYEVTDNTSVEDMTYLIDMDLGSGGTLDGFLEDRLGYTHFDGYWRTRGGTSIEFDYMGHHWIFERQF
jgi:hypothetical protein